jgi:hypothetical protein
MLERLNIITMPTFLNFQRSPSNNAKTFRFPVQRTDIIFDLDLSSALPSIIQSFLNRRQNTIITTNIMQYITYISKLFTISRITPRTLSISYIFTPLSIFFLLHGNFIHQLHQKLHQIVLRLTLFIPLLTTISSVFVDNLIGTCPRNSCIIWSQTHLYW